MATIVAQAGLTVLGELGKLLVRSAGPSDLVSYTRAARVEPIALVDTDVMYSEATPDTMQSLLSLFMGYYLQAFALSANVGNISVVRQLEKLNPNRSAYDETAGAVITSLESYKDRLPVPGDDRGEKLTMEASKNDAGTAVVRNIGEEVNKVVNLSVGKMVNVEVSDGSEKKATIPVSFRLLANSIPTESMVHILSVGSKDNSFNARWRGFKSGRLEFWRDLVLCQDIIDEHKKALMNDKEGFFEAILNRRRNNTFASIFSGQPSLATASNLIVISDNTKTKLELGLNGPLSNFKVRQRMFENTYLMILAVINESRGLVTFYTRGIPEPTTVSFREMKASNKGGGPDIADILAAYKLGNNPGL